MALHRILTGFGPVGGTAEHGEQNQGIGIHGGHNVSPEARPTVKLNCTIDILHQIVYINTEQILTRRKILIIFGFVVMNKNKNRSKKK